MLLRSGSRRWAYPAAIYPGPARLARDPRFNGYRRNFLNLFQMNPRLRVPANNAASDAAAMTVYEYSEMALHTPPLAPGLTVLDLVRQAPDRYLGGMKDYGMTGYWAGTYPFHLCQRHGRHLRPGYPCLGQQDHGPDAAKDERGRIPPV